MASQPFTLSLVDSCPNSFSWVKPSVSSVYQSNSQLRKINNITYSDFTDLELLVGSCTFAFTLYFFYRRIGVAEGMLQWSLIIWNINCPSKNKLFVWLTLSNIIPTWDNLINKFGFGPRKCPLYTENSSSIFLICLFYARTSLGCGPSSHK